MDSLTAFAASWEIAVTWVAIARRDNLHCDSIYKDCVCLLFEEALDWEANAIDLSLGMINALIDYWALFDMEPSASLVGVVLNHQ